MASSSGDGFNRRDFLRAALAGSSAALLGGCPGTAGAPGDTGVADRGADGQLTFPEGGTDRRLVDAPPATQPNILVIMSDEHNASLLGAAGNAWIQSPALDGLAQAGVLFDTCYCNSPLCVPSRLAFTSGKYVSRVGAWNNDCRLPTAGYPSLPRILNAAGYQSYLCGKMHYDATCRYGFTEIGGNMNANTMTGKGDRRSPDDLTPLAGISDRFAECKIDTTSSVLEHDRQVTQGAVDFLGQRKAGDGPFFLLTGFLAPHFPLVVADAFYQNYKGKIPLPAIPAGHLASQPLNYQHLRIAFNVEDVPPATVTFARELYYGLTEWLDKQVGKVLAALAASPAAANTVVVYTADHGENMGEHGLWWKNCMYEHAARVPLIISWPARWKGGQRRAGACSLVDVVQTIGELGRAKVPSDWNGSSLCAWMDDPAAAWKNRAVSEYYAHNIASGYAMIRSGSHKYVYHTAADAQHPAQRELYDLGQDPGELQNLASAASEQARVQQLHAALVQELGEDPEKTELRCRADYAKGY